MCACSADWVTLIASRVVAAGKRRRIPHHVPIGALPAHPLFCTTTLQLVAAESQRPFA
jgi:hypothetical protein